MNLIKLALLALATTFCLQAHAQRTPVPIADFANIPVVDYTAKPVTPEQVRASFLRGGSSQRWDFTPVSEGVMEGKYVKDNKHTVVVVIKYTGTQYSLTYKDSINMKYEEIGSGPMDSFRQNSSQQMYNNNRSNAANKQAKHFANDPLTRYVTLRPVGEIHPFYETWVRTLLTNVGTELKLL